MARRRAIPSSRPEGTISSPTSNAALDAVGCERAVVLGASVYGQNAITFAAAHPERVGALVLADTFGYYMRDDDCMFGMPADRFELWLAMAEQTWAPRQTVNSLPPVRRPTSGSVSGGVGAPAWA